MNDPIQSIKDIKALNPGGGFKVIAVLRSKAARKTKVEKPYLSVDFGDQTAVATASVWSDGRPYAVVEKIPEGSVIWVVGAADFYNGNFSPKIDHIVLATEEEIAAHQTRLVVSSEFSVPEMEEAFRKTVASISAPALRALVAAILNELGVARIRTSPAARGVHHAWRGGLLEHTLSMLKLVDSILPNYAHLPISRDLVIAGIALHDVCKVEEYSQGLVATLTVRGRLLGHVAMVYGVMVKHATALKVDQATTDALGHILLSHHGQLEYGAPVVPCTPEAVLVHQIDMIDARMGAVYTAMRGDPGKEITGYVKALGGELVVGYGGKAAPASAPAATAA